MSEHNALVLCLKTFKRFKKKPTSNLNYKVWIFAGKSCAWSVNEFVFPLGLRSKFFLKNFNAINIWKKGSPRKNHHYISVYLIIFSICNKQIKKIEFKGLIFANKGFNILMLKNYEEKDFAHHRKTTFIFPFILKYFPFEINKFKKIEFKGLLTHFSWPTFLHI